jgi:hypothetical protein
MMILPRRTVIQGLISLIAAPTIVRVSSIMPVRAMAVEELYWQERDVTIHLTIPPYVNATFFPILRPDGTPITAGELFAGEEYTIDLRTRRLVP